MLRALTDYSWLDADHEILFDAIRGLFQRAPREILAHLPAELARSGFPDISCDALAAHSSLDSESAIRRARELLHAEK